MFYAQSTSTVLYQGESWGVLKKIFFLNKIQTKGPVDRNYTLEMSGRGGAAWFKHPLHEKQASWGAIRRRVSICKVYAQ